MNSDKRKIIFRVDGNSSIGLGHIVRCCALADMLKDNFDCYFHVRKTSKEIIADIRKYCTSVSELNDQVSYEKEAVIWSRTLNREEIVVLDGYQFNTQYQSEIKSKGCQL